VFFRSLGHDRQHPGLAYGALRGVAHSASPVQNTESCTIAITASAARLSPCGCHVHCQAQRMTRSRSPIGRAFNRATAARGDDLPLVDVGTTPASAPPTPARRPHRPSRSRAHISHTVFPADNGGHALGGQHEDRVDDSGTRVARASRSRGEQQL
jgi:hypothetical protein